MNDEQMRQILNRDPIAEFESVFGKVHPEKDPDQLGIPLLQHAYRVNRDKADALKQADDTNYSCDLPRYLRIIGEIGFRKVLEIPFRAKSNPDREERLLAFWRNDGIFMHFDTFGGDHVNGGQFHYNWRPNGEYPPSIISSSSWEYISDEKRMECEAHKPPRIDWNSGKEEQNVNDELWKVWNREWFHQNAVLVGYHDCREAVRFNIRQLEKYGSFVCPWVKSERTFGLYLVHHGDKDDIDMSDHRAWGRMADQKNKERFAMLPEDVRKGMGLEA